MLALVAYSAAVYSGLTLVHILSARLLGFRVEIATLGPITIVQGDTFNPGQVVSWRTFSVCLAIAPDVRLRQLRGYAHFGIGLATLFILLSASYVLLEVAAAIDMPSAIVQLGPNAFGYGVLNVITVVILSYIVESMIHIWPGKKRQGFGNVPGSV